MTQPTRYDKAFNFAQYAALHASAPFPPASLDTELDGIETTLDGLCTNLALIQRDDGALTNSLVTVDSLDSAVKALMGDWNPRGVWVTATNYAVADMVTPTGGTITYVCAVAHTSAADFVTDLNDGYWQPVNGVGSTALTASSISFSASDRILGRASSGSGAGEEIACTAAARSILDDATVADIRTTLGVGTASNPTFGTTTVANLIDSGLTASSMIYANASKQLTSTAAPTDGQLLIGSTAANPVLAALTGTTNQVVVTNGAGSITLSLPQDIDTACDLVVGTLEVDGMVGVGTAPAATAQLYTVVNATLAGTQQYGHATSIVGASDGTDLVSAYQGTVQSTAAAYTLDYAVGFFSTAAVAGGGSTINNDVGFYAGDRSAGGANIGFLSGQTAGSGNWAVLAAGDAESAFGGAIRLTGSLGLNSSIGAACDVFLQRDGANAPAFRNGANATSLRWYYSFTDASNYHRGGLNGGADYVELAAETAGTGADNIDVRLTPAGTGATRAMAASGAAANIRYATAHLTAVSGASVTATNLIPDGAFVLGVVTRITTALGTSGGTTGYQVGDGSDADRWGAIAAVTLGTTSTNADATADFSGAFTTANNVVLTAVGGNFDGTGAIRVTVLYIDCTAPTA